MLGCPKSGNSFDLYRAAVNGLPEVWLGAKLEAVARKNIPCWPRARIIVPALHNCPDMIMKLIKASNSNLPTHGWKVPKVEQETVGHYRSALVLINSESLAPLAATKGVIRYGFDEIVIRIYKKDEDSLNTPPTEAPLVEGKASLPPIMEVDATTQVEPSTSTAPNKPSDVEAKPTVDSSSDMDTEDATLGITLSEEDLLHS
ncbi:uncharacterized protein LOC129939229 [Eupeodes corollae]|uniref:uncharacterized protein LOC129939229 n=1 Tax=Eupeodes corollae TaxID=290404 RepID=UPI00248F84D6|nr:uncharacterized protein LOC129939229 [Eupeodes corollae]